MLLLYLLGFLAHLVAYVLGIEPTGVLDPLWTTSPFNPPAIPLAVRSPYLSAWAQGGNGSQPLSNQWPKLSDMAHILGWAIFVRVDNVAYRIMGQAPLASGAQVANQTGFSFSATQTKFVHQAGNVMVTSTFISPIEPQDLVIQSIPASYLAISTQSTDNTLHDIQVYSDISGEWISGDNSLQEMWETTVTSSSVIHSVHLQDPQQFVISNNHIQDATAYYGMATGGGAITWQTAADVTARGNFMKSGRLPNSTDSNFRAVSDAFPVFAISIDLGTITSTNAPAVFGLGLIRDPAIRGLSPSGEPENRSLYFWTRFSTALETMDFFLSDFTRALSVARSFDSSIRSAATAISTNYADLIDLSTRQVFGMIEITAGKDAKGNWNTSDVQAFMNDGSLGTSTVDVLFPAFPLFLKTNPVIAGALLKPLLQWQQGNGYPNPWAAHDLGTQYPIALGNTKDIVMPIEESANMLVMTLAQARASGDGSLISNNYAILQKWGSYLRANALNPGDQSFSDAVLTGPVNNDTNLALKGILGIQAMAEIASALNDSATVDNYKNISTSMIDQWQTLAFAPGGSQLLLNFENTSSSLGLPYNLYIDKLLGFNLIPQSVYDHVAESMTAKFQPYGIALDSRSPTASKSDWALFTAATLTDINARNELISLVRAYAANQLNHNPFSDYYDVSEGKSLGLSNRPVQGAMYSILALQIPTKPIVVPPPSSPSSLSPSPNNTSAASIEKSNSLLSVVFSAAIATAAVWLISLS